MSSDHNLVANMFLETTSSLELAETLVSKLKAVQRTELSVSEQLISMKERLEMVELQNTLLKNQNRTLRKEVSSYHEELFHVRSVLERQSKISSEIAATRRELIQLPPEILQIIFLQGLPPSFLLNASISSGFASLWSQTMQFKKSIVQVCRSWNAVGSHILYEDIAFFHIGQIPSLARSLEEHPDRLGKLIKRVIINCFIPRGYNTLFHAQVQRLVLLCPRAFHIAFLSSIAPSDLKPLPIVNSSITQIDFGRGIDFTAAAATLAYACHTLVSLSLYVPDNEVSKDTPHLFFERLENLSWHAIYEGKTLPIIQSLWSMPNLQRLTFRVSEYTTSAVVSLTHMYKSIRTNYGRKLKFLHIDTSCLWSVPTLLFSLQSILDVCPVLEHLVLHPNMSMHVTHPTVVWIDAWTSPIYKTQEYDFLHSLTRKAFPALRGVRALDGNLGVRPDIPTMVLPDTPVAIDEAFEFQIEGLRVRHDHGYLYRGEIVTVDANGTFNSPIDLNSDGDDDGSDFVPESSNGDDEWSEAHSSDSDTSRGTASDEFDSEDDWEADLDSTMDIYQQTSVYFD